MKNKIIPLLFSLVAISCKNKDNQEDYEGWIVEFPYNDCGQYKIRDTCTCNTQTVWLDKKNYHYGDTIGRLTLREKLTKDLHEVDSLIKQRDAEYQRIITEIYESE